MTRPAVPTIAEPTMPWVQTQSRGADAERRAPRRSWRTLRDTMLTAVAMATVLACVFGVGPFERPDGSFETFLSSPTSR